MEEDTEYLKLPLEDRCIHKLWRARVHGYEECIKHFPTIADEKSSEFTKFAPLMKKFVTDSNAVAQEKALEAVLVFAENAHIAQKTSTDVASGIVAKALGGPRRGTIEKAELVLLMYCEIEKHAIVQEELIKGLAAKNPKVVAACVKILTTALREFGHQVIAPKPLVKQFSRLLEDRDKNIREEGKKLVVELYRWIGDALKPQLNSLKPLQVSELEAEFEKLAGEKAVQTRFLRSQQELKEKMQAAGEDEGEDVEDDEVDTAKAVDPLDLMDPVDILSKLPADFYEKVEAKKWQERKEAMELLLPHTQHPKLENGDYHDLMKALKKIIAKDTNVMIVALAGQCVAGIARGLKKKFSIFAVVCTETILEKFKEKKPNVVTALREAVDAIFPTTSLEALQEIISAALSNKNPNVKAETAGFVARSFCYCTPAVLNKKMIKAYATDLLKTLNEPDPTVRDNSAEALGTLLKVVGEKILMPFLGDIDNLKMQKIKESSEKAEIKVKVPAAKSKPKPAPVTVSAASSRPASSSRSTSAARPAAAKAPPKRAKGSGAGGGGGSGGALAMSESSEPEMSMEEVLEKAEEVLGAALLAQLADANWKERLEAMESINNNVVSGLDASASCQALVRVIAQHKPGLKDNNFQVIKLKITALQALAENTNFSRTSCEACLSELVEKLGDVKNGPSTSSCLTAMAEAASLEWLGPEVMTKAFAQKSPKVQEAALLWLAQAVTDFGLIVQPKSVISDIKKGLSSTNPGVRNAAIALCGTIHLHMGPALRTFLEDEKPALLQQIDAEIEKNKGRKAPAPTRRRRVVGGGGGGGGGARGGGGGGGDGDLHDGDDDDPTSEDVANSNVADLIPRTSIAEQITDELVAELADKNWKVRSEALGKCSSIVSAAKFITADWGELGNALNARLSDTNKNLSLEAVKLLGQLAEAAGPHCSRHTRTVLPGLLAAMGDSKANIRAAAQGVLDTWVEHAKLKDVVEGDACVEALKSGSVFLKAALFPWIGEHLTDAPPKSINKEDLANYVPHIYTGIEDRSAEVRKAASDAVLPFMLHLGYEGMMKHMSRVKPASKNSLMAVLDKARQNLPAKPAPAPVARQTSAVKMTPPANKPGAQQRPQTGGGSGSGGPGLKKPVRATTAPASTGRGKPGEEQDTAPLLPVNGSKQQRASDEQKLRVLRWDFTTPRQEFITQLKDQMTAAGLNRTLITNMFHKDFNFHKKSIDALNDDLHENLEACICNLDMVLRWISLRFFDTNPSVIIKAMDYLQSVFTALAEDGYHLMDFEAYSFLPFLVQKFGDPKDGIRGPARNIVRIICNIYPASKVSPYLMEGLKTKNARQRAECLEAVGSLIETAGMSVCQPSPGVALKEVAKQISDKDKAVRNAALNALVQVYFREGEKVYKYIGTLSSKDMGFLEERIKQAGKNRPVFRKPETPVSVNNMSGNAEPTAAPRTGVRGVNRVIPVPASEFNPIRGSAAAGGGGGGDATVPGDVNSLLQRAGSTSTSDRSYDTTSQEQLYHNNYNSDQQLYHNNYNSDQQLYSDYGSSGDLPRLNGHCYSSNIYGGSSGEDHFGCSYVRPNTASGCDRNYSSSDNLVLCSTDRTPIHNNTNSHVSSSVASWIQKQIRSCAAVTSPALQEARRISRSLSFILGEEPLYIPPLPTGGGTSINPPGEGNNRMLITQRRLPEGGGPLSTLAEGRGHFVGQYPLSGAGMPPLLTRTVTSPQILGYRQRSVASNNSSGGAGTNSAFQLDYSFVEKLLEEDDNRPIQVEVESIPDLSFLLNFNAVCPPTSSRLARPGFTTVQRSNANLDAEDAAQAINLVVSQVSSSSTAVVVRALCQLDEVVCSNEELRWRQLLPHVDQLLVMAAVQYRLVLSTKMSDPAAGDDCVKIYRSLTNTLMMIFNQPTLAMEASRDVLTDVWHVLLSTLVDPRLAVLDDGPQIIRAFNVLVVRMAEKANFTNMFSASLKLLHDGVMTSGGGGGSKFSELVLKCTWKMIQMLSKRSADLDLAVVLKDVHHFLITYPMNTWADRSDVPLRTIKTVIHTLCKIYGYSILPHLDSLAGVHGSDLHKYITKTLKKVCNESSGDLNRASAGALDNQQNLLQQHSNNAPSQLGVAAGAVPHAKSPKRLSKAANNSLSEIFRKIGSKENTKEGLVELYEFQLLHPEADIGPFLSKSSQFFQNYIERGLKKVKMEREMKANALASHLNSETNSNSGPLSSIQVSIGGHQTNTSSAAFNMNELVDQFKTMASQAGFDNTYIDTAVKDICSAKTDPVKDYNKILQSVSEFAQEQKKD